MELLIGCGSRKHKQLVINNNKKWSDLVTLDINKDHDPDVVWDLNVRPLPFEKETFDEIHAYEVLEHLGRQGDYKAFFEEWMEWYRILKPGGMFFATVPSPTSIWAWGDPSHTRIISRETLVFLNQPSYTAQIGKTAMSDFRYLFTGDFDILHSNYNTNSSTHEFVLQAVKPSRITYEK